MRSSAVEVDVGKLRHTPEVFNGKIRHSSEAEGGRMRHTPNPDPGLCIAFFLLPPGRRQF